MLKRFVTVAEELKEPVSLLTYIMAECDHTAANDFGNYISCTIVLLICMYNVYTYSTFPSSAPFLLFSHIPAPPFSLTCHQLLAGWGKLEESKMLLAQGEAPGKLAIYFCSFIQVDIAFK